MTIVELAHDVQGSGPLLVLVHGITENRHSWDPITADLAATHRVLRVDLRGHGESPSADVHDVASLAADIAPLRRSSPANPSAADAAHGRLLADHH